MPRKSIASRLFDKVREMLETWMDRAHSSKHPSGAEARLIEAFGPALSRLTPNDKWTLGAHIPTWLKALDAPPALPLPTSKRIFIFCAYRGQFTMDFSAAVLLAWRGHQVTIGYLPKLQSPIKAPLADHPSAKPYLASALGRVESMSRGRIRCIDLSDEIVEGVEIDDAAIQRKVRSDVIMFSMRETLDMRNRAIKEAWDYYKEQAQRTRKLALSFLGRNRDQFDLCIVPNGTTFEGAQFFGAAKQLGIPVNCNEKFAFRNVRILSHGGDFSQLGDVQRVWARREELGYLEPAFFAAATERAYGLLDERRNASKATWAWSLQNTQQTTEESLLAAGVPPGKEFVLVCPNVPYDAGYDTLLGIFGSMREWLQETVRFLLESTDLDVVVRAHPAEGAYWGGRENSAETLVDYLKHPRLTFIAHDRKVNTYGLMETCKFGAVFSSTTGLEMAMLGKRVVVGSGVYYSGKGFTTDASDRNGYFANMLDLARITEPLVLDDSQRDAARLFHFILHFAQQWPYPYDKPSGVRRLPPEKLVRGEMTPYLPYLDALALTPDEWELAMPDFLRPGRSHVAVAPA